MAVSPGDKISGRFPASEFNTMLSVNEWWRKVGRPGLGQQSRLDENRDGIIFVKNITDDPLDPFSVVGLGETVLETSPNLATFQAQVCIEGDIPDILSRGRFAILQDGIAAGKTGPALVFGITPCKMNVESEDDRFADIADGETDYLQTGNGGAAHILWKDAGTGQQWGIIVLGNFDGSGWIAKNGGSAIPARAGTTPGSGTVTLYYIDESDELTSLGIDVTAYNLSTSEVAADAWLQLKMESGSYKLLVAWEDCS